MSNSEQADSKKRFRDALEKKNQMSKEPSTSGDSVGGRKVQASSRKVPKMFRRKSG
jgi:hypothetical protein